MAAIRLKLFDHLSAPQSPEQLSETLEIDAVALDSLLVALLSLELLTRDEAGAYQNTPLTERFLASSSPQSMAAALLYNADVYPLWGQLDEVIKRGDTAKDPEAYLGQDEERTRRFVYGMHHRALGVGRLVSGAIDLSGASLLADIGGGPGTYASLLTERFEGLKADVLDLPAVVKVAEEIVGQLGAQERVQCTAYDYYRDALPNRPYDAALISGVLHREQPTKVRAMFAELAARLPRGGQVWLSDVMLNDERTGPVFSAMFGLNMRVLSHDGRCHAAGELIEWLSEAGFETFKRETLPAPLHYTIIGARRR
jgi:hypothetical protein